MALHLLLEFDGALPQTLEIAGMLLLLPRAEGVEACYVVAEHGDRLVVLLLRGLDVDQAEPTAFAHHEVVPHGLKTGIEQLRGRLLQLVAAVQLLPHEVRALAQPPLLQCAQPTRER
ncbi:hypothetical protein, partial [uncultured Alistipes sp.]|uniref:hypothetical protein n=1 Tax=uncultured Alistipes sp. TaxID=538949 RepID=UPI0026DF52E4